MTKKGMTMIMLKLRQQMLRDTGFDHMRDLLAEEGYSSDDVDSILDSFGDWVQSEINNIDTRMHRLQYPRKKGA